MKLIVGIDPGLTAAVALLDANSDYCKTTSRRNFSFSEMCEAVAEEGDPIIIASDTEHAPQLLKKIAATFGCRLFAPKHDMMVGEKKYLTEKLEYNNDHERDALASAVRAKQEFMPLFEKIGYYLGKKGMENLAPDVTELIVKGEAANIELAVKMLTVEQRRETKVISKIIESKKVLELREKILQLEKGKSILENYSKRLEEENMLLKKQAADAKRPRQKDTKLLLLEGAISQLRRENEKLKTELEGYKNLPEDLEIIHPFREGENFEGRTVIAEKKEQIKLLEKQKPKAIICDYLMQTDIPMIPKDKINIRSMGNLLVADKKELDKAIQESFFVWLKGYRERHVEKI